MSEKIRPLEIAFMSRDIRPPNETATGRQKSRSYGKIRPSRVGRNGGLQGRSKGGLNEHTF